jgi:phage tail sheath protein FI
MPGTYDHPGVYIEEIPSGVHTIMGVSTSIAAFVGWAAKGPTDEARRVQSFLDFARLFGGLDRRSLLGYAVQQFFANGGRDAYIIRLVAGNAVAAKFTLDNKLTVSACSPGKWANDYQVLTELRADDPKRFRLSVIYQPQGQPPARVESFENLSMDVSDRRSVTSVVNDASEYIRVGLVGTPVDPPADSTTAFTTGANGDVLEPGTPAFEALLPPAAAAAGVYLLDRVDGFNLLCVPGETDESVLAELQTFCHDRRAFLLVDCNEEDTVQTLSSAPSGALLSSDAVNSALYFPWVKVADPADQNRIRPFPPCGFVAGIYARTDSTRGVWKAPAGTEAGVAGAAGTAVTLTDGENGILNPRGINCIRTLPVYGTVVWGSRTLHGADERGSEWKYVPVRRLALYIEESLFRGTKWAVFEGNDERLWAQLRLNVGTFMHDLFRQGAFQGTSPRDAYYVKCDKETTTQSDINRGIVNVVVGFAPLKPAEFVVIQIQQMAGQVQA